MRQRGADIRELPGGSCLLVIPRHFYSFEQLFTQELASRGYTVTVSNDEFPAGTLGKLMGKLRIPLLAFITEKVLYDNFVHGRTYDLVLIFKGRGINASLVQKLTHCSTRIIGYNWDSFAFNSAPLRWMRAATAYYTFDYRDAEAHSLPVVELFSSADFADNQTPPIKDIFISAIFRNHSRRLAYLDRVLGILGVENCRTYIYEQNIFFFILNFLHSPLLYWKYRHHVSFQPLKYADYTDIIRRSRYTIDYAHPDQTGLTMRSFEALSVGTRIITNNTYISHSDYFDASNAVLFPEGSSGDDLRQKMQASGDIPAKCKIRTLADFFDDLLR